VLGTQAVATLIAVYGLFMAPLGWKLAGFVWAYALAWALINDRIKLLAYKIFDPVKAEVKPEAKADAKPDAKGEPKPEVKAESKPEEKAAPTPEAKADEPKPEAKTEPKPEAKTRSDLTPRIAKRAYELYGERAGNDGTAVRDWKKAEQEIRNDESKAHQLKPEAKADAPKPEAKADEPKPEAKSEPRPEPKADAPTPEVKTDAPASEAKAEPKPEAKNETQTDVSPQLVKRVHEFYEELGRKDVQAVQELENSELGPEKHGAHK
jgi:hypothetical protein